MLDQARRIFTQSLHGSAWQAAALASRLAFLLLVLPFLPEGELGRYLFVTSLAVIGGRLLILGLDAELPLLIRGSRRRLDRRALILHPFWFTIIPLLLLSIALSNLFLDAMVFGLLVAHGLVLGGLIHSLSPAKFERLLYLPWLLFGVFAITQLFTDAGELVLLRSLTLLAVQIVILWQCGLIVSPRLIGFPALFRTIKRVFRNSWSKLASNVSMIAILRGFIIWPGLFFPLEDLDKIAFAVACGEALWQLGMVFGNREYARYAVEAVVPSEVVKTLAVLAGMLSGFAWLAIWTATQIGIFPASQSPNLLVAAALFYAVLCGYSSLRFLLWSQRRFESGIFFLQTLIIAGQVALVVLVAPPLWFGFAACLVLGALIVSTKWAVQTTHEES